MIYINIGSNLNSSTGDRFYNLKKSIDLIKLKKIKIINISNIYETPSYPNEKNPKFLNVCLAVQSKEKPDLLIKIFKSIEKKLQRSRGFSSIRRYSEARAPGTLVVSMGCDANFPFGLLVTCKTRRICIHRYYDRRNLRYIDVPKCLDDYLA